VKIFVVNIEFEIDNLEHIWSYSNGLERTTELNADELKQSILKRIKYHRDGNPFPDNYKLLKIDVRLK
jgi:hypothetical protein